MNTDKGEGAAVGLLFPKPEKQKKDRFKKKKGRKKKEKSDLLLPKPVYQKRKKHGKSILQPKSDRRCYLCMLLDNDYSTKRSLHEHHVLFGNGHAFAEAEGLKVNLCTEKHHKEGPAAVHNNYKNAELLMRIAQEEWEKTHSHEEWMLHVEKNYL